jgi:hypothetical protein
VIKVVNLVTGGVTYLEDGPSSRLTLDSVAAIRPVPGLPNEVQRPRPYTPSLPLRVAYLRVHTPIPLLNPLSTSSFARPRHPLGTNRIQRSTPSTETPPLHPGDSGPAASLPLGPKLGGWSTSA